MGAVTAIKRCFFPLNVPVCTWSMVDDMNLYALTGWSSLYAPRWAWLMCIDWQLTQVEVTFCSNNSSDCFKDETAQCPAEFKGRLRPETRPRVCIEHVLQTSCPEKHTSNNSGTSLQVWRWWNEPSTQQYPIKKIIENCNRCTVSEYNASDMPHCFTFNRKEIQLFLFTRE